MEPLLHKFSNSEKRKFNRSLASQLRKRQAARIEAQKNPDGSPFEARKTSKNGSIRSKAKMFEMLRTARHMKISANADGAAIGFKGSAAFIAKIHQEGLTANVVPDGPLYQYPVRKLLGFSDSDRALILSSFTEYLYS